MKTNVIAITLLSLLLATASLLGCSQESDAPDFSGYTDIAELATLECCYHNVAEVRNDGKYILFGAVNVGHKKVWVEYWGTVKLGVDASKVNVSTPDHNNVVTIAVPDAGVLGSPYIDTDNKDSFANVYSDTGLFQQVTLEDIGGAFENA